MVQRLDIKSARYDRLSECVLMEGRGITLAVTLDALEALYDRAFDPDEAVIKAIEEARRLTRLAEIVPADDGRVLITRDRLLNDGRFAVAEAEHVSDSRKSDGLGSSRHAD